MSKYEPLRELLSRAATSCVPMTFSDIERVIGQPLPSSARKHRAWWSNNPGNSVITLAWLAAGYESSQVDMAAERLVFRRKYGEPPPDDSPSSPTPFVPSTSPAAPQLPEPAAPRARRHPLYGILKGKFTLAPGTDLTRPADPEWGKELYGD